uniref:Putative secreted protein n=1 Tax=Anopheles darlingi TaxID=43151 RepID=A0A2M4DEQ5_ANODA
MMMMMIGFSVVSLAAFSRVVAGLCPGVVKELILFSDGGHVHQHRYPPDTGPPSQGGKMKEERAHTHSHTHDMPGYLTSVPGYDYAAHTQGLLAG